MKPTAPVIPTLLFALSLLAAGCSRQEDDQSRAGTNNASLQPVNSLTGEPLFNERCRNCHKIDGKGGAVGSDLTRIGIKRNSLQLEQAIREPSQSFPGSPMPTYHLSVKQINSLVDYLGALK